MPKAKSKCKYCGTPRLRGNLCGTCGEKLRLIRKMQAMVRAEKEREEARLACMTSNKSNNE